jgi:hypothetical protein
MQPLKEILAKATRARIDDEYWVPLSASKDIVCADGRKITAVDMLHNSIRVGDRTIVVNDTEVVLYER